MPTLNPPWEVPLHGLPSPDIATLAQECLRGQSYSALKCISCAFAEGVLTLQGCLPTFYLKQLAQAAVTQIQGITRIDNHIQVGRLHPRA